MTMHKLPLLRVKPLFPQRVFSYSSKNLLSRYFLQLQTNESELKSSAIASGQFLFYHHKGLRPLLSSSGTPLWKSFGDIPLSDPIEALRPLVLLHVNKKYTPFFALSTAKLDDDRIKELEKGSAYFSDLRGSIFGLGDSSEVSGLTKGWSLLKWHQKTQFCRYCGTSNLKRSLDGHKISCGECREIFYPPTYPVGIVLIVNGTGNKVLLVNLHRHPKNVYSCVAGFTDVGETMESCIIREAEEEVGVEVEKVEYLRSQHWPFPTGSLMMGFRAVAKHEELEILPDEVKDARWFERTEINKALLTPAKVDFHLPPRGTIARTLIEEWAQ